MTDTRISSSRLVGCLAVLAAAAAAISGCSDKQQATAPVTGKVMFQGKPLVGGGTITFVPEKGKAATGVIGKDGTFTLTTYDEGDGAIVGEHRVEIEQNIVLQQAEYAEQSGAALDDSGSEKQSSAKPTKPEVLVSKKDRIPEIYSNNESPIKKTVKEGDNDFTIELKGDVGDGEEN